MSKVKIVDSELQENGEFFEDLIEIVKICRIEALDAISHFFDLLDIDKDVIKEMKKIKIYIKNNKGANWVGAHNQYNNKTSLDLKWFVDVYMAYLNGQISYNIMILSFTETLIHEYLHSLRDFMFKQSDFSSDYFNQKYDEYYIKYNHLIKKSEEMQLLSIKETNSYYLFVFYADDGFIEERVSKDIVDKKGLENVIENIKNDYKKNFYCLKLEDYPAKYYIKNVDSICINKHTELIGIEECLIDCFSYIIYEHRRKNEFDFNSINNFIESLTYQYLYGLGFDIILMMSIDDIKWFFTSYMEDEYNDRYTKLLGKDLEQLLQLLNKMHDKNICNINYNDIYQKCRKIVYKGN